MEREIVDLLRKRQKRQRVSALRKHINFAPLESHRISQMSLARIPSLTFVCSLLQARYRRRKCQRLDFSFFGNKKTKVSPGRNGVVAARQIIPSELWMWDCTPRPVAAAVKGVSCGFFL